MASSSAAAKKNPAVTVPSPPPKKGSDNKTAPSSSLRNQRYATRIENVSSNPTSNAASSKQVVTRLWSKGAVVKQINAVQDASAPKCPPQQMPDDEATKKDHPQHMFGLGLRKSPPEVNLDVITKSPTNFVGAAASTLIYQKNNVDGNSGGKGGRTELYDSEDTDENEGNASGLEDDSSYEHEDDVVLVHEGLERLVYSDDEAYLFEVDSEDDFRTSFPKDRARKNIIPGGPPKPDVRGMSKPEADIVLKAYGKERKAYTNKQRCARVKECQSVSVSKMSAYSGDNSTQLRTMKDVESNRLEEDHTFASKDILNLRIAEEANLRCIKIKVKRSDSTHFVVLGI